MISSSIAIAALSSIASVSLKLKITTSWSARSGLMTRTISRADAIERIWRTLEPMEFQRIVIDPDICEGKATIRDTRMTVEFVLKLLGAGYTAPDVIREYPGLELADIYECATFGAWLASDNTVSVG